MKRWLFALAACGGAQVPHGEHASLSLAADERMVLIPAGRYIAGSTPEERAAAYDDFQASANRDAARENHWFDREEQRHVAELPAFRIDLMPVTQAEYAEFVGAGKAPPPAMDAATWRAQGFMQDYDSEVRRFVWQDRQPPSGREDHPVVLVAWREAAAYCAWRGEQRGSARRLPTAAELEKAARGDNGLAYPWGNAFEASRLDSAVGGPRDTVAVGSFPDGASPYGVLGMAGNVFQWTSTPWAEPGAQKMTVKGSAWDDFAGVGRGASAHGRAIVARHVIVGFRCAADAN